MKITVKQIRYVLPAHIQSLGKTKPIECEVIQEGLPWNDDKRYCVVKLPDGQVWGCKKYDHWQLRQRFTDMEVK